MQNQLLLEILTEEIPYSLQKQLITDINTLFANALNTNAINFSNIQVKATCRRICVIVNDIASTTTALSQEKKGPKIDANQNAIDGFLRQNNLTMQQLTQKNGFYFANITTNATATADIIGFIITQQVLAKVKFKKSMHWNESKVFWARPIISILCILQVNNSVNFINSINFANVTSSNYTLGHRFLSLTNSPIIVNNIADYFSKLQQNYVILCQNQRKQHILQQATAIANKYNATLVDNWVLDEIVYLTEYPVVLESVIDNKYLHLPKQLIITIMANNQRYLNLQTQQGNLLPNYIIVANNLPKDNGAEIIKGNNKVLVARLEDGLFFYNQDLKTPLTNNIQKLKNITFFQDLGSYHNKVTSMQALFNNLVQNNVLTNLTANDINHITTAIQLCKADLVSGAVQEMPELQGIMGGYYYQQQNNNSAQTTLIANGIKTHYKPQGPADSLPANYIGSIVSFIDKLDTLQQLFAIGKKPTGSSDPYALRRNALAIIRFLTASSNNVATENKFNNNIVFSLLTNNIELQEFFTERFKNYLAETIQISKDTINQILADLYSILAIKGTTGLCYLYNSHNNTLQTINRINKMLASANYTYSHNTNALSQINTNLFTTNQEKQLYNQLTASNINIAQLHTACNNFFEIKIIDNNTASNTNKLHLLALANYYFANYLYNQSINYINSN